jgi:hypothetical protein
MTQASAYDRFVHAARMGLDQWRDGSSHDLDAIREASDEERSKIEQFLLSRGIDSYRDVQAVVELDSPTGWLALEKLLVTGSPEVRAAISRCAPDLVPADQRETELVGRIALADAYDGLDGTLSDIQSLHTPAVIDAMLQRIARDPGVAAVHFAAMLLYVHDQAAEPFDWDQRPFFLRFNAGDDLDRAAAIRELCQRVGVDASRYVVR